MQNTGTEQHRHHAVEVALYNLFSYLWEIETGKVYQMMKANDIYSGLGGEATIKFKEFLEEDVVEEDKKHEEEVEVVVQDDEVSTSGADESNDKEGDEQGNPTKGK